MFAEGGPIFSGVGLTSSALHRRELLGVFGQFAPLLSEVQIHLPSCRIRSCHSETLAFSHLLPAHFNPFAHSLITGEERRTFLWLKARCLIRQSSVRSAVSPTAARSGSLPCRNPMRLGRHPANEPDHARPSLPL